MLAPSQHEEWERTRPSYKDGYISPYAALQTDIEEGIRRPRTAQSSIHPGNGRLYAGGSWMASSMSNLHDSGFRGFDSGSRPASRASLRKAEASLRADYLVRNISATSLAAPPPPSRLGDSTTSLALDATPRPSTAHSVRRFGHSSASTSISTLSRKPSLDINAAAAAADISTPTFGIGAPPKSPLGQFELASPIRSDTASLFGDDTPEKIAHEITSRITREEEMAKARIVEEERRRAQAELEAQRRQNMEASRSMTVVACPSPPASVEGENEKPVIFVPGPNSSPRLPGRPFQQPDGRRPGPGPRGQAPMYGPAGQRPGPGPGPGPRPQPSPRPPISTAPINERPGSRGGRIFRPEGPSSSPSPGLPPLAVARERDVNQGGNVMGPPQRRDGSQPRKAPVSQKLLIPQSTNDPVRGTTTTTNSVLKATPRSPLFQQMNPFDVHSDEENDDDDKAEFTKTHTTTTTTTTATTAEDRRAPYGIPSPPLSHRQRPNDEDHDKDEEEESMPVIRTVRAKRDTILVGGPGRTSLGLQIEEFERTLQQAQAMSALENKMSDLDVSNAVGGCFGAAAAAIATGSGTRSRAGSNCSSNYSEISESPMTIEPALVSPKPFPLSPRPIGPAIRSHHHPTPSDITSPLERPSLEARSERTFGPYRRETDESCVTNQSGRRPTLEERPESPAAGAARALRPRIGGPAVVAASGLRRPTWEEYGKVKINTSLAGRNVHRPSPDEYGPVRIKRTESPFRSESSVSVASSTFRVDSPIIKAVRHGHGVGQDSEDSGSSTSNSVQTSRTNSPVPTTSTGSYSVFSPPPPAQPPSSAAKRIAATTTLPLPSVASSSSALSGLHSWQQPEWYGPAPTAPPSSPLPIPERSARRKNTAELGGSTNTPAAAAPTSKLDSSASIVPDIDANPNWPLPGPSTFVFPPPPPVPQHEAGAVESGFAARRSLFRDRRAPPAPLNIAATKYADDVGCGGELAAGGPWTPDAVRQPLSASPVEDGTMPPASSFLLARSSTAPSSGAAAQQQQGDDDGDELLQEDKSAAIGVARGLSIRYDRMREQERRGRGRTRQRQVAAAFGRVDEDADAAAATTTTTISSSTHTSPPPTTTTTTADSRQTAEADEVRIEGSD